MKHDKEQIMCDMDDLLEYYLNKIEDCNSIADIHELNWSVKDKVNCIWRDMFNDVIAVAEAVKNDSQD